MRLVFEYRVHAVHLIIAATHADLEVVSLRLPSRVEQVQQVPADPGSVQAQSLAVVALSCFLA